MIPDGVIIEVIAAELVGDYKLELSFSNGIQRVVDFEPFLQRSANPQIRAYLDLARFSGFRVEDSDLVWDDYGLCFPIADLYENEI